MRISLLGYGKMGKAIEREAVSRGHEVVHRISRSNPADWQRLSSESTDVVIEFTHPSSFDYNLDKVLEMGIPMITGTTGWYDRAEEIAEKVLGVKGTFLYGANFSIGVNILFQINKQLAKLMNPYGDYDVFIEERHHKNKADGPSGTAHVLAQQVLDYLDRKEKVAGPEALQNRPPTAEELSMGYVRSGDIKGTHTVSYVSDIDSLSITHEAYSRRGFALGAVIAAEWLYQKPNGFYDFADIFE